MTLNNSLYFHVLEPLGGEDTIRVMLGVEEFQYREEYDAFMTCKYHTCGFFFKGKKIYVTRGLSKTGLVFYRVWDLERGSSILHPEEIKDGFERFVGCSLL